MTISEICDIMTSGNRKNQYFSAITMNGEFSGGIYL
jgi:hypothetical protein